MGLRWPDVQKYLLGHPRHSAPTLRGDLPFSSITPHLWQSRTLFPGWWMGGQGVGKPWGCLTLTQA